MENLEEIKNMIEIAHLYYKNGLTQKQIAKRLNVSRSLISKLLVRAREKGIVEVIIHEDLIRINQPLEDRMKRIFGMKEVICAEPVSGQTDREAVAACAGKYLEKRLPNIKYAALSGGKMMNEVAVQFVPSVQLEHVTFVPLCGGVDDERWELQANVICEYFASHCNASNMQYHAPVVVDSEAAKEVLMNQRYIKNVMLKAKQAEIALVGIGTGKRYFDIAENYLAKEQCEKNKMQELIQGDVIFNYFDSEGELIDCPWNRQNMTLGLKDLSRIPEVVGIASDLEKAASVYTAARKKIVNSLIVTAPLAKRVLKLHTKYL